MGLRLVDRRHDRPAKAVEFDRAVGGHHRFPPIASGLHHAAAAPQRLLDTSVVDRQKAHRRSQGPHLLEHVPRDSLVGERGQQALGVLDHEAGAAAECPVWADEIALAGLSEPGIRPGVICREHLVERLDRKLEDEDPEQLRSLVDRAADEGHRLAEAGGKLLEVGDHEVVALLVPLEAADERGQLCGRVGADLEVRGELGGLRVAVNDVERIGIDDEEILETENPDGTGKLLVEAGVDPPVFRGVARGGFEGLLPSIRGRVGGEVVVLKVARRRRGREILLENRLATAALVELREVVSGVERRQRFRLRRGERRLGELAVGGREIPRCGRHRLAVRHRDHLIAEGVEHHRDVERLGRADRRHSLPERLVEGFPAGVVADPGDGADRRQTHPQKEENDLRLNAQSAEGSHGLLSWSGGGAASEP